MSALIAMNGPPRLPILYSSPREHWLASVPSDAAGMTAPELMKVVLPSKPMLAFDWIFDRVTYLHSNCDSEAAS